MKTSVCKLWWSDTEYFKRNTSGFLFLSLLAANDDDLFIMINFFDLTIMSSKTRTMGL